MSASNLVSIVNYSSQLPTQDQIKKFKVSEEKWLFTLLVNGREGKIELQRFQEICTAIREKFRDQIAGDEFETSLIYSLSGDEERQGCYQKRQGWHHHFYFLGSKEDDDDQKALIDSVESFVQNQKISIVEKRVQREERERKSLEEEKL